MSPRPSKPTWPAENRRHCSPPRERLPRWDSWSGATFRQKMDAEIAERKAREQAEAEKKPE
jgi:hypothetical protein